MYFLFYIIIFLFMVMQVILVELCIMLLGMASKFYLKLFILKKKK